MYEKLKLRPIAQADQDFLYRLYASTREDEMAILGWGAAQKDAFLRMQFQAQHQFYQERFNRAEYHIILLDGEPIGRLYVDRRAAEIRIIDIALLTEYRNQGIGSIFLERILSEGEQTSLPVRIHVEQYNPALRLYYRLGFRKTGENGVYSLMEWLPETPCVNRSQVVAA
jgi:ribosomal protein S18 acetylase RimI-like enzyme